MSWIALLLIGVGITDLTHSVRPGRVLPQRVGALVMVALGLAAGLTEVRDLLALLVLAGVVLLWGHTVTRGFGRGPAWLTLLALGVSLGLAVVLSPAAGEAGGAVTDWLEHTPVPALRDLSADRALLLLGALLVQLSTGNVVVRLVLRATGTTNPARGASHDATRALKGGRLLGPMERVFILGLALAGHVTAASVVVAAKGLLRFPELQSRRDSADEPGIDEITEYFLVGSFVSWSIPLVTLVLLL